MIMIIRKIAMTTAAIILGSCELEALFKANRNLQALMPPINKDFLRLVSS